jgi:hypothetical protein
MGVTELGVYRGVPLFVDEVLYEDFDSTTKSYVPDNCVLVASSAIQSTMAYAGISQVSEDGNTIRIWEGRRVPFIFFDQSGEDYRRFRLSSRPCRFRQTWTAGPSCKCWLNNW